MKKFLAIILFFPFIGFAQKNTDSYAEMLSNHPLCGLNISFTGIPTTKYVSPFASCHTLATGFGVKASYPNEGIKELGMVIVALSQAGKWDEKFKPLSPTLPCKLLPPLGTGPFIDSPGDPRPVCNSSNVRKFFEDYNKKSNVIEFRRMESAMNKLDLTNPNDLTKVKQAEAIIRAAAGEVSFGDVADLLE